MKKSFLFIILSFLLLSGHAHGYDVRGLQPLSPNAVFSTFSADSLQKGKYGISLGIESSGHPDFFRFTGAAAYGITDTTEVSMTTHFITQWQGITDGFEDIALGLKHRFFDEGKYGPSIAYLVNFSIPSQKNEFTTEGSIGGGLIISKKVGPVKGHANIFYSWPGTKKYNDNIIFSAGIDFSASHDIKLLAEIYGKKSYAGSFDKLESRLGYRIVSAENLLITIGAGFDINNPEYRALISFTYLLPTETKNIKKILEQQD